MKLHTVHIREFKSIWDSNDFETGQVTCLVGKNEAGKTAVLEALYRLNPIVPTEGNFDVTDDYPRAEVENYRQAVETNQRPPAVVVQATFALETAELDAIRQDLGEGVLNGDVLVVSKGYTKSGSGDCTRNVSVPVHEDVAVRNLVAKFDLPDGVRERAGQQKTLAQLAEYLDSKAKEAEHATAASRAAAEQIEDEAQKAAAIEGLKKLAESEQAKALRAQVVAYLSRPLGMYIWSTHLEERFPKFLYFNEYYQMRGHDNVEALKKRKAENNLQKSDHPLLGLIELARLNLDELLTATRTQQLKNKLEGASNQLTARILKYWSQNRHLQMRFDVRPGLPGDPDGMQQGTNIWGEVYDSRHLVSTGLATRSTGFVWFFSFLAWYSATKKKNEPLVLLLDEPGLSLHGKAQEDLLRFFEAEIASNPKHQLIYTTHSPFMVDPRRFERVRIVQDRGVDALEPLPQEEDGTKVFKDVLQAGPDTLFPLQGALGYEIHQTLFVGPNCLVVEGVSDLLYIQTISGLLQASGRLGLDERWTITPVGGSDKVPTFVALLGAQKGLKIATLIDFQKGDQQTIENLYKRHLLEKSHVLTFATFTGKPEADIEDMFDEGFYLGLVNGEFRTSVTLADLVGRSPRIVVRLKEHFKTNPLPGSGAFNHYRPARFLAEKVATLTFPQPSLDRFDAAFTAINALLR